MSGNVIPADGRMFEMGPYWIRMQKKGLIIVQEGGSTQKVMKKSLAEKKNKKGTKK